MFDPVKDAAPDMRPEVLQLVRQARDDASAWATAELALAKIELGDLKAKALKVVVCAVVMLAAMFCALVVLSQAGIALLATYTGSVGVAALIVAGLLIALLVITFVVMRNSLSWQPESAVFRWFTNSQPSGRR